MFLKQAVRYCLVCAISVVILTTSTLSLSAQQNDQLASANERINFSGKLRMLSQRAAAAGCNLSAGVDEEKSRQILALTSAEFGKILRGLQKGSSDLNINGAETDNAVLSALQEVNEQWLAFDAAILELAKDSTSSADINVINSQNMALLDSAQNLVKSVLGSYSNYSADSGFGKVIDIAGRQRMLSQKMSKEACQIWSGQNSDEQIETLRATIGLFENSLLSLRDGTDGLIEPPTELLEKGLVVIWDEWTAIKPVLGQALAKQTIDLDARQKLSRAINQMLRDMNSVVGLYTVAQKERGNIDDEGATERVNFSGKLRMLSQRVAAAACNYKAGVETEQSRATLINAQAEFAKIAQALTVGDADLRIYGKEMRRKTLEALAKVNREWDQINVAVDKLLQGESVDENLALIIDLNMPLLSAAKLLVSEISGEYSDPTVMLQSDAMLVDISGRQRMLSQKISKETCLIWSGETEVIEDLSGTIQQFEVSLQALREGLESAGIRPAPTAEIRYDLDDIFINWQSLKPSLERASSGEAVDLEQRAVLLQALDTILADMNTVVGLYTIYGKTGL